MHPLSSLFVSFLFLSGSVSAQAGEIEKEKPLSPVFEKTFVHLQTRCKVGKAEFDLLLANDLKEEDQEFKDFGYPYVWIRAKGGKPILALEAVQSNELLFLMTRDDAKQAKFTACKETSAFEQKDGTVVILLTQNARPFNDHLSVVFYDPKKGKVIDSKKSLGAYHDFDREGNSLIVEFRDDPTDGGLSPVEYRGKKYKVEEEPASHWSRVAIWKEKVSVSVDRSLTWSRSRWKPYFKTQADFERAFGYEPLNKVYLSTWTYSIDSNPPCMQASTGRSPKKGDRGWHCK